MFKTTYHTVQAYNWYSPSVDYNYKRNPLFCGSLDLYSRVIPIQLCMYLLCYTALGLHYCVTVLNHPPQQCPTRIYTLATYITLLHHMIFLLYHMITIYLLMLNQFEHILCKLLTQLAEYLLQSADPSLTYSLSCGSCDST